MTAKDLRALCDRALRIAPYMNDHSQAQRLLRTMASELAARLDREAVECVACTSEVDWQARAEKAENELAARLAQVATAVREVATEGNWDGDFAVSVVEAVLTHLRASGVALGPGDSELAAAIRAKRGMR